MEFLISTEYPQGFYCSEITKVSTGGGTQRETRLGNDSGANDAWGSTIFANTSGVACTEWQSYTTQEPAPRDSFFATSSIQNLEFVFLPSLVIIFLLVVILIFNIFKMENPWKQS